MNFPPNSGLTLSTPKGVLETESPPVHGLLISQSLQKIHSTLFELSPEAILVIDPLGRILQVNAQVEEKFGYTRDELLGGTVERLIPERFREVYRRHREDHQASAKFSGVKPGIEMCGLRKDGNEFPVDINLCPIHAEDGSACYCVVRDLSEQVAARHLAVHLEFERVISGLSTRFLNLPADQVDLEIHGGLRQLAEALQTERASLAQVDRASGDFVVTHSFAMEGIPLFPERIASAILPWLAERTLRAEITVIENAESLPPEARLEREYIESAGVKSSLIVPMCVGHEVIGGMSTDSFHGFERWDDTIVSRIKDVAEIFASALARKRADEALHKAMAQIRELQERLERENIYLRDEIQLEHSHAEVVGNSAAIRVVLRKAEQVAPTDSVVLILGETGTGKELVSRTIHRMSRRSQRPLVKINCAALPATLIESELFGREKGAYTGALAREIGRFELAHQSTIFLDEIGELPLELQPKLLRFLQEGEFERLGSSRTLRVDARVIAATNRNLEAMVKEGKFRQDLFYRLNVFPILIPPLREHSEDIPALVWHILKDLEKRMGRRVEGVHAATMQRFQAYPWPGNVREVRNLIERNLILNTGPIFRAEVPELNPEDARQLHRLDEVEIEHFRKVLKTTHWRVRGRGGAAEVLGLKPTTLEAKLKKLGLQRQN